jgi:hypothetical protein
MDNIQGTCGGHKPLPYTCDAQLGEISACFCHANHHPSHIDHSQAFNPDVRVHNHLSYLSYEWSDLTNWAEARYRGLSMHGPMQP